MDNKASVELTGAETHLSVEPFTDYILSANPDVEVAFSVTVAGDGFLSNLLVTAAESAGENRLAIETLKADGLACRTADLEVGAGEMTVKNLTCTQESSLDVGMGKLTIDGGSLDGKNEVSCGMGVAEVAVSRPADYGYALESGMGSVTIDDYSHSGMGVELEVNRSAATFYDIECGMGEVTITFN